MKNVIVRGSTLATLTLLLGVGSVTLSGCFEKDGDGVQACGTPQGGTCDTAATVVDLSATTGCGLALQLADSTYLIPTGSTWTDFHPTTGQKVTVGYSVEKRASSQNTCPAGKLVKLGCITLVASAT